MPAPSRELIGTIECLCCGKPMPLKRNALKTLAINCQWCDLGAFARDGSEAAQLILKRAVLKAAPAAPEPKPAPKAALKGGDQTPAKSYPPENPAEKSAPAAPARTSAKFPWEKA